MMEQTAQQIDSLDLTSEYPRSPREKLGDYIMLPRIIDKCRATINGTQGAYTYGINMDSHFFRFTGIDADTFKVFVATGADDAAILAWVNKHSQVTNREDKIRWANQVRETRMTDMPIGLQVALEDYIEAYLPKDVIFYRVMDIYDIEEGRIKPFVFTS